LQYFGISPGQTGYKRRFQGNNARLRCILQVLGNTYVSIGAALLFAAHPVHVEVW